MRDDEKERPDEGQEDAAGAAGISRRELLRRAAIAGGGTVFYQAAAGLGMFTSLARERGRSDGDLPGNTYAKA